MNDRMLAGFLAGGVAGAAIALLLAPQSGDATRERIRRRVRDTAGSALDLKERLVDTGEKIGNEAKRRVQEAGSALAGERPRTARADGEDHVRT